MKNKIRDFIAGFGFITFLIGASMMDNEKLLIPTIISFAGMAIFYTTAKDIEYEEDEYEDD